MSTARKTLDLFFQAKQLSDDIFREVISNFMQAKSVKKIKKGKISLNELNKRSHGKLENIEVSDKNIASFITTAKKHDINFAIKCDKSMKPPMWHVFFDTSETKNFKKAFSEYAKNVTENDNSRNQRSVVAKLDQVDKSINHKSIEHSKERHMNRGELSL